MNWKEKLTRLLNLIYARCLGYFWTPCPRCGAKFGEHELRGVCPTAAFEVEEKQAKFYRFVCPHCKRLEIPSDQLGRYVII